MILSATIAAWPTVFRNCFSSSHYLELRRDVDELLFVEDVFTKG
jgi:hypothetical protein